MHKLHNMTIAKSDAFGLVPQSLRFLQKSIEAISPFNDEAVAELRAKHPDIEIDRCIRAHIANNIGSPEMQVSPSVIDSLIVYPEEQAEAEQLLENIRLKLPVN